MIDTHTHFFLPEFKNDVAEVIRASKEAGVEQCWMPGINFASLGEMLPLKKQYGDYFELFAGLHPTEIGKDYREELRKIYGALSEEAAIYKGIGEIGLDLYWDKTYRKEQEDALCIQLDWALAMKKPVILHIRNAFDEVMPIIRTYYSKGLKGIFHCFSGNLEQALELTEHGFLLGINGSITFKKSPQQAFLNKIPLCGIVTETDSPYMSPVPLRGKRNQSANLPIILNVIAGLYGLPVEKVEAQTVLNAKTL